MIKKGTFWLNLFIEKLCVVANSNGFKYSVDIKIIFQFNIYGFWHV